MSNCNEYYCYNGVFYKSDNNVVNLSNRALSYGDAFFETIFVSKKNIMFFEKHFERILFSAKILKLDIPEFFTIEYLKNKIIDLLNRNKSFVGTRIKIVFFRDSTGLYSPDNNNMAFLIFSVKLDNYLYTFNKKGIFINVYNDIQKPVNILSNIKTTNTLLNVLAGIYKKEQNLDDVILLNQDGFVCETISSNIFVVKDNIIYTPSLDDGCVKGIMRENIIDVALNLKMSVIDEAHISLKDIETADEIFITNAISGLRWVLGYKQKRFYNSVSKNIFNALINIYF